MYSTRRVVWFDKVGELTRHGLHLGTEGLESGGGTSGTYQNRISSRSRTTLACIIGGGSPRM